MGLERQKMKAEIEVLLNWIFSQGWWFLLAVIISLIVWYETRGIHQR
jgi:hypothetical protein